MKLNIKIRCHMCCDDFISKQNSEKLEKLQKRSLNSKSFHEYYLRSRYVFHLNNKPCNVFCHFPLPWSNWQYFFRSIFLFGKSRFDILYKNQWGYLNTAFATFRVITRKNLEISGKAQELLKRTLVQENV